MDALLTAPASYHAAVVPVRNLGDWPTDRYHFPRCELDSMIDADTPEIKLRLPAWSWSSQRIRLRWVDAPEVGQPGETEARAWLEGKLRPGCWVRTFKRARSDEPQRSFERLLGDIWIEDGGMLMDVAALGVEAGVFAWRMRALR